MFKNLQELIATMPNDATCRDYLVQVRWNGKPICPYCFCDRSYVIEGGKRFKCANSDCYKKYSVTVGTIFEASNIKLNKWLTALYLCTAHKKGISSYQLAKDIGVSQKTAWFMLHRLRELMRVRKTELMVDTVEADETYMGRKYGSDYVGLSPEEAEYKASKGKSNKGAVLGLYERKTGKMVVKAFDANNSDNVRSEIKKNVTPGSDLYTDESYLYRNGLNEYYKSSVFHAKREWVRGDIHTNHVENFWSVMKRGVYGIYHQISFKHLQRYCDEYAYRYNSRQLKDGERFKISLTQIEGRLTYKRLINKA